MKKAGRSRDPSPRLAALATPLPQGEGPQRICVAQIGGAHGLRGEVRLKAFTADSMAIAQYGPLENKDGSKQFEIASMRPTKGGLIAQLQGVKDRNAAEALRNLYLYVLRDRLAAAEDDEFYHADLIGLAVVDGGDRALGTVVAVKNFGAGDLLEIAPDAGGPSALVPFTQAAAPVVDIAGGRIVVDPPEGTFEPSRKGGG